MVNINLIFEFENTKNCTKSPFQSIRNYSMALSPLSKLPPLVRFCLFGVELCGELW
jgi:hypothetical protein